MMQVEDRKITREDTLKYYNPSYVGNTRAGIFGLPFKEEESEVIIMPVPWDVTVSNAPGTSAGPDNVLHQSYQIDLYDEFFPDAWKSGIFMKPIDPKLVERNKQLRSISSQYINDLEKGIHISELRKKDLEEINNQSLKLYQYVKKTSSEVLQSGKLPVLLGGDHSTPLGFISALRKKHQDFGILHIDAHADLREKYEGFIHSHASVMFNAMQYPEITRLVQVGLRDICEEEKLRIDESRERIIPFFDRDIHSRLFEGETWQSICDNIVKLLPPKVYISFDIDGLTPSLAISTGTPVPGGLTYQQAIYLIEKIVRSGRKIIGFDLVETGPNPADGVVSCRLLYKTIAMMVYSNNKNDHP